LQGQRVLLKKQGGEFNMKKQNEFGRVQDKMVAGMLGTIESGTILEIE